jgi:hypothetical protein
MERAGTADDEEAVRLAHDDLNGIFAAFDDALEGCLCDWDFFEEQLGWNQGILTHDYVERNISAGVLTFDMTEANGGVILRVSSVLRGSMSSPGMMKGCLGVNDKELRFEGQRFTAACTSAIVGLYVV